jgi:hypothetical protein
VGRLSCDGAVCLPGVHELRYPPLRLEHDGRGAQGMGVRAPRRTGRCCGRLSIKRAGTPASPTGGTTVGARPPSAPQEGTPKRLLLQPCRNSRSAQRARGRHPAAGTARSERIRPEPANRPVRPRQSRFFPPRHRPRAAEGRYSLPYTPRGTRRSLGSGVPGRGCPPIAPDPARVPVR